MVLKQQLFMPEDESPKKNNCQELTCLVFLHESVPNIGAHGDESWHSFRLRTPPIDISVFFCDFITLK